MSPERWNAKVYAALGLAAAACTTGGVRQVLHEEVHPITDPIVMEEWDDAVTRDTRPGTRGYALHQALESTAVAATEALLQQRAPDWMPAFSAWKTRVGA